MSSPHKRDRIPEQHPSKADRSPAAGSVATSMDMQLLYTSIIEDSDDAIFVESLDGYIITWNRSAEALYGYTAQEMIRRTIDDLLPPQCHSEINDLREQARLGKHTEPFTTIHQHKDGLSIDVSINFSPVRDQAGQVIAVSAIVRNIAKEKQAAEALRQSEERFALAARGANGGLWDWDLRTDTIHFSPRWKEMLGYQEDQITDQPHEWFGRVSSKDLSQLQADIAMHLAGQTSQLHSQFRMEHHNGELHWMLVRGIAVYDEQGNEIRITGWLTDIREQKTIEDQLRRAAQHDKLTHLPNRALLIDRINSAIKRRQRNPKHNYAILFLDFDRFKIINDSLGHAVGDELLISIAEQLKDFTRSVDTAARLGGDEFVVLLDGLPHVDDAIVVAQRMLDTFAKPHHLDGHEVTSTASIGIVTSDANCASADTAIRDADTAMYQAKQSGKARYVIFDEHMHEAAVQRHELEKGLRKALELDQFRMVYQPILCLESGGIIGFEALIRWQHLTRGFIPPDQFIAIAEEINLITPIGEWVLDQACAQLAIWTKRFNREIPLTMNVNVSKLQLIQPQIVECWCQLIDRHEIERSRIKLEITESAIMDDRAEISPVLEVLREAGIPLVMDDFGTGYSSLSCLHRFPINVLKIDQSFVNTLDERIEFTAVIQAIVTLAHTLGISVVAEGIETAEQLAQLQALECDHGQGYFLAKPLSADDATQYLIDTNDQQTTLKRSA